MREPLKILVVEDDLEWRRALKEMYETLLPLHDIEWSFASDTGEAVSQLTDRNRVFDLLSLDFLLGGTDGRLVLRVAHKNQTCRAVLFITGFDQKQEFEIVVEDPDERRVVAMTLDAYIQSRFPGNHIYLKKDLELPIGQNIEILRNALSGGCLLGLIGPRRVFRCEGEIWCMTFGGSTVNLAHSLGIAFIAHLLANPFRQFSCLQLEDQVKGRPKDPDGIPDPVWDIAVGNIIPVSLPQTRERDDRVLLRKYRDQIKALRASMDEPELMSSDTQEAYRQQIEELQVKIGSLFEKSL